MRGLGWWMLLCLAFWILLIFGIRSCTAAEIPQEIALHCIMGEARGEGKAGMQAVSEVLRRRGSIKGFYGCNAKFEEPEYVWQQARQAWEDSKTSNLTKDAMYFESTDFKTPYWAKEMKETAHIGKHIFYVESDTL